MDKWLAEEGVGNGAGVSMKVLNGYLVLIPDNREDTRLRRERTLLEQKKREIEQARQEVMTELG